MLAAESALIIKGIGKLFLSVKGVFTKPGVMTLTSTIPFSSI